MGNSERSAAAAVLALIGLLALSDAALAATRSCSASAGYVVGTDQRRGQAAQAARATLSIRTGRFGVIERSASRVLASNARSAACERAARDTLAELNAEHPYLAFAQRLCVGPWRAERIVHATSVVVEAGDESESMTLVGGPINCADYTPASPLREGESPLIRNLDEHCQDFATKITALEMALTSLNCPWSRPADVPNFTSGYDPSRQIDAWREDCRESRARKTRYWYLAMRGQLATCMGTRRDGLIASAMPQQVPAFCERAAVMALKFDQIFITFSQFMYPWPSLLPNTNCTRSDRGASVRPIEYYREQCLNQTAIAGEDQVGQVCNSDTRPICLRADRNRSPYFMITMMSAQRYMRFCWSRIPVGGSVISFPTTLSGG